MPQNVRIRLNVGGTVLHTSLYTLMEGARRGGVVFQCLCAQILGPLPPSIQGASASCSGDWAQRVVPAQAEQYRVEHFVDADPTSFSCWLNWLRTEEVPFVKMGADRTSLIRASERAGFAVLAEELRGLVDWRREDLQLLLVRPGVNLHGARLAGQDLSMLGFVECILGRADLSACNLSCCSFQRGDLRFAILEGSILEGANLEAATVQHANLKNCEMQKARLKGADLSGCDLSGCDMREADVSGAILNGANLAGANLEGANLEGVKGAKPGQTRSRPTSSRQTCSICSIRRCFPTKTADSRCAQTPRCPQTHSSSRPTLRAAQSNGSQL